jgi:hypothetical protein
MTAVSNTQPARPAQPRHAPSRTPEPTPADRNAMKEALEAARGRMGSPQPNAQAPKAGPQGPQPREGKGLEGKGLATLLKGEAKPGKQGQEKLGEHVAQPQTRAQDEQPMSGIERRQERREQMEGFALPGQPGAPAPLPMPAMPSPQANPAAFAQMMADLWARENGKGTREVSVRFGNDAWPATGARLIRNAAGALDIVLEVGGARADTPDLSTLADALDGAGVELGALTVEAA